MIALRRKFATCLSIATLLLVATLVVTASPASAQSDGRAVADEAPVGGHVPGQSLGGSSDAEIWRAVRHGLQGNVSIPDKQAGIMIQSEGDNWRAWRNGPLTVYSAWILLGMLGLLALFFAVRGRIKIDSGPSGKTVERFNGIERAVHWLTAVSFVLLALTGLNLLFGRHIFIPVFGKEFFAVLTLGGKYVHNYVSFAFMVGIVLMFVLWIRHNLPTRHDLAWLAKGGGLFAKGVHPPSEKFNAGQKVIFWSVVLGGASLSLSGIALLFPFQMSLFAGTFEILNVFGANLPTALTPIQEMQYAQLWHAIVGAIMIAIILAHIYIGSLGMEGAFAAMGSGQVDRNWAREHHNLWYAKLTGGTGGGHHQQPAE
jgi:formate dehydrogenase subunit gamma